MTAVTNQKRLDWKTLPELREFVTNTPWETERGQPWGQTSKRNFLSAMNDEENYLAAVSFNYHSDLVEVWYTKLNPFSEFGCWPVIPGFRYMALQLEMAKLETDQQQNQ